MGSGDGRRLLRLTILGVVVMVSGLVGTVAWSAEAVVKVGICDREKVLLGIQERAPKESGKTAAARRTLQPDPLKSEEAEKIREEIRRLTQELEQAKDLSEEERRQREEEIARTRKKLVDLAAKARRKAGGTAQTPDGKAELEHQLRRTIAEYAEEKGLVAVFERDHWSSRERRHAIILPRNAVDITQEIIDRLKATAR